jgi:hypothetical protein
MEKERADQAGSRQNVEIFALDHRQILKKI